MLSRSYRLRKKEIERVRKKGQIRRDRYFNIKFSANRASHFRIAIVIPKRIIAKAVARNRIKRKIAESLTQKDLGHFDIIMTLKTNTSEKDIVNEMARFKINSLVSKNSFA